MMMVVAGKLLATTPVHYNPDELENEFYNWLVIMIFLVEMVAGWRIVAIRST